MRQAVKSLFASDMAERNLTPIIASHNLRELEDICDHVGLLHKGGILLSGEKDQLLEEYGVLRLSDDEAGDVAADAVAAKRRGSPSVGLLCGPCR